MDACTDRTLGGRYRLRSLLGRGGVADVYRAHDPVGDRDVALKVFRPSCELVDAERRRRQEVDVLAALHHPGIVALIDADVSDESAAAGRAPFIAFELVDGPTLRTRIAQGPLGEDAVATLGARLADTLAHVHRHGIVHRDVKPANILLPHGPGAEDGAKLTDFGIARIVDSTRMTAEGLTVGTASYLSPEQVTSAPVGTASDVYSLGLVLIEALTGTAVYAGRGVETVLRRLQAQPELPDDLNPPLAATLTAMTARDPAHRPSAREAARQLTSVAEPSLVNDIMALGAAERALARHRRPPRRIWQRTARTARAPRVARAA